MELNPFESSFALKDLITPKASLEYDNAVGPANNDVNSTASSTTTTSTSSGNNSSSATSNHDQGTLLKNDASSSEVHPASVAATSDASAEHSTTADGGVAPSTVEARRKSVISSTSDATRKTSASDSSGTNKPNLRILNLQSANNERIPGVTPPVFTPGGRRLPPIHFLPNAALGSPGTPGSMWNSLLSATSAGANALDPQSQYAQFLNLMRKSGLTPNESNLRFGFTPGAVPHAAPHGFNFVGTPGQMTPGLHLLLGLASHEADQFVDAEGNRQTANLPSATITEPVAEDKTNSSSGAVPAAYRAPSPAPAASPVKVKEEATARPAKRARKLTKKLKPEGPTGKELEDADDEGKRKQFLERNRVAASKCRQRKKQLFSKMESELAFYSSGYRELLAQVTQLRDQMLLLRGILIGHKDCPALVSAMGGFLQLQSIIGQTDYVAQAAAQLQPNYTSMPSTIPTTLNPTPPKGQPLGLGPDIAMLQAPVSDTTASLAQHVDLLIQAQQNPSLLAQLNHTQMGQHHLNPMNQNPLNQLNQSQMSPNQLTQNLLTTNPLNQNQLAQNTLSQNQINQNTLNQNQLSQNQLSQNQLGQNQLSHNTLNQNSLNQGQLNQELNPLMGSTSGNQGTHQQLSGQIANLPHSLAGQQMMQNQPLRQNVGYGDIEMSTGLLRNYSLGDLASNNVEADNQRRVISTTDLLSKVGGANGYGLRPVASMADLQSHTTPLGKHFEL